MYCNQNKELTGARLPEKQAASCPCSYQQLNKWLNGMDLTDFPAVSMSETERALQRYLGTNYVHIVPDGSAAVFLALAALTSPLLGERSLRPGDEIITMASAAAPLIAAIVGLGAVPVVIDVTSDGAPDVSLLEDALSPNTRAVLLSHTAGYPFDLKAARNFCNDYELWLIEDATEAFDATYDFDGTCYKAGTVGDIGTGCLAQREGDLGFVCTRDDNLSLILQALRNDVLHWMVPSCAVLPSCADVRRASADRLAQALSPFAKRVEALRGTVHAAPASLPVLFACPDDRAAVIRQLELAKIPYRLPTNVANEPFFLQLCRENKARVFAVPTVAEKLAACGLLLSFDNEAGTVAALREALQ